MTSPPPRSADADISELRALVAEMGGLAEAAIDGAMRALIRRDVEGAAAIVEGDARIDALEAELERRATRLIALRAAFPADLREAIAAMKIAKRVPMLQDSRGIEPLSILPAMARATIEMVHAALDAFAARDPEAAIRVCASDRTVDDFYNSLFRALLTYMMENPPSISACTHLLFIAKNLERIGDHATNIAEMVHYAATGEKLVERARGYDALAAAE